MAFTNWATPPLPLAPCVLAGHCTVEPVPSVHTLGAAFTRKLVKFCVVPEPSERWTTVIVVLGSFAFGLSVLIAASFQVVIVPWKILAIVSAESFRSVSPDTLYDTVIGATTVGK